MKRWGQIQQNFRKILDLLTPKTGDSNTVRRGYILNLVIITYGLLYSLSIPFVVISVNNRVNLGLLTVVLAIVALFALYFSTIYLSLKGRVTLAGYLLIGVLLFSNLATFLTITLTPGSLTGAHLGSYYILVIIATLAVGPKTGLVTAVLCGGAAFLPTFFNESFKQLSPSVQTTIVEDLRIHFVYLIGVASFLTVSFHAVGRTVIAVLNRQNQELKAANAQLNLRQLKDAELSETLVKLAEQLSYISTAQTDRTSDQARFVSDISATLTELNQTAQQMAGVARMVLEAAQNTLTVATHNGEAVAQSTHDFDDLKHDMHSLALIASQLYNQSEKVGEVMDFLNEVADETHLLGINATIEASEAGMQGLRFGVVAAEIQNLADRSRRSTQQVKLVVSQVKAGIEQTFKLTSQGLDKAAQTAHISQAAGHAIDQIIANADNSMVLAQTISSVCNQQQNATNYVTGMIKELEVTSRAAVKQTEQIAETATILLNTASRLKQMHLPPEVDKTSRTLAADQLPPPGQAISTESRQELVQV